MPDEPAPQDSGTEPDDQNPTPQDPPPQDPPQNRASDPDDLGDAGKQAIDRMKAERNAAQSQAKALQKELDKVRQAAMSDSERAVAEAEVRGRATALGEVGQKLARARFDALAGRRNADVDTAQVLEFVDLSRFVDDSGDLDEKAIKAAVERLVPEPVGNTPSFDGGARTTASKTTDMNSLIRAYAARRATT